MTSINREIDEAVPLMKARAAEVDSGRIYGHGVSPYPRDWSSLVEEAQASAGALWADFPLHSGPGSDEEILDCMNLCALALSVLGKET